jgi:hypothetical protein
MLYDGKRIIKIIAVNYFKMKKYLHYTEYAQQISQKRNVTFSETDIACGCLNVDIRGCNVVWTCG